MPLVSERREVLLGLIVDELLAHGVGELSLRPLAARVGASARLLIYHFETKENLLACALAQVRARADAKLSELWARERPTSLEGVLFMFWDWATAPPNQGYFRLLFEVDGLSMFERPGAVGRAREDGGAVWRGMIERAAGAVARGKGGDSTLILGALSGLLQDFLSTGDRARTTAALSRLVALMSGQAPGNEARS